MWRVRLRLLMPSEPESRRKPCSKLVGVGSHPVEYSSEKEEDGDERTLPR